MPKGGLEPPHLAAPVPETGVSTISPPGQETSEVDCRPSTAVCQDFAELDSAHKAPWVEQVVGI